MRKALSESSYVRDLENFEFEKKEASLRRTAELWEYHPVPEDDPYPAEEIRYDDCSLYWGNVIAARVRGRSHMYYGTNCDDWYEIGSIKDEGILCIAVSDGAGSCKFSRIGSRIICGFSVDFMIRQLKEKITSCPQFMDQLKQDKEINADLRGYFTSFMVRSALHARNFVFTDSQWRQNITGYSELKDYHDMSATLILVVMIPAGDDFLVVSFQVGDGAAAVINRSSSCSEAVTVLGKGDSGQFAGETQFITSLKAQELDEWNTRVFIKRCSPDMLLVMSDGVSEDYTPFVPELCRLYLDLAANNIFPDRHFCINDDITVMKLPEPMIFQGIRDPKAKVMIHYVWRIIHNLGISLDELWQKSGVLSNNYDASLMKGTPGQRLAYWLENYAEVNSSDDRTLILVRCAKKMEQEYDYKENYGCFL